MRGLTVLFIFILYSANGIGLTQLVQSSDSLRKHIISNILILGGEHTHDEVVLRELTFKSGDTLINLNLELQRSRSNIINTQLFNFVELKKNIIDSSFTELIIVLKERWYIWPLPVFKFADPNFNTWWLNKNFSRTNYGGLLLWKNFRGWNEDLAFKAQFGYSKEFLIYYRMPYLTMKQRMGMQVSANYTQQEEITVGTINNKRIFYRSGSGKSRIEMGGKLSFFYRRKLYSTHTITTTYQNLQINDSITRMTKDYFFANKPHSEFPGIYYGYRFDKRDNKGYTLKGILVQAELFKYGLSLFAEKNLNVVYLQAFVKNYLTFSKRWFAATQLRGKYTVTQTLPYFLQQGLGYDNYLRGYEYYVVDGQHYALFKSNLKYSLFKPRTFPVDFLKSTNFYMFHYAVYLNAYFDAGYVWDKKYANLNPLSNSFLYSGGIGLDIVTFYDKVIRFEYSINRKMEQGFFVHFVQPI